MTEQFYVLLRPSKCGLSVTTEYQQTDDFNVGIAPVCPQCRQPIGLLEWLPPLEVELEIWEEPGIAVYPDILFGTGPDLLVTGRFALAYQKSGLTGLSGFEPVKIVQEVIRAGSRSRPHPPNYYRAIVSRSTATFDINASRAEYAHPDQICPECRSGDLKRWASTLLEPGTWDGNDVFEARGLGGVIMTSGRFRVFCENEGFQFLCFKPAENYGYDYYPREH